MWVKTKNEVLFEIDDSDWEIVKEFNWHCRKSGRIGASFNQESFDLSRMLMGFPIGLCVDHADRNVLNNKRSNLRVCTYSQNNINSAARSGSKSSVYKGVSFDKKRNRWQVHIRFHGKKMRCGRYKSEIEAARAYNNKAKELFGKFAWLNPVD